MSKNKTTEPPDSLLVPLGEELCELLDKSIIKLGVGCGLYAKVYLSRSSITSSLAGTRPYRLPKVETVRVRHPDLKDMLEPPVVTMFNEVMNMIDDEMIDNSNELLYVLQNNTTWQALLLDSKVITGKLAQATKDYPDFDFAEWVEDQARHWEVAKEADVEPDEENGDG